MVGEGPTWWEERPKKSSDLYMCTVSYATHRQTKLQENMCLLKPSVVKNNPQNKLPCHTC